jgi:hypothetical protein
MKTLPLLLTCLLGTLLAGCVVAPNRGRNAHPEREEFIGQQFPLSAGGGTLTVTSYRQNGAEYRAHPTSPAANAFRASVNHFIAELPASAKGPQTRITLAVDSKADNHLGKAMLTAGLEAGLTMGVLGNNVPHDYTSHVDSTVTVTGKDGQSRTYHGSGEAKDRWMQAEGTHAGAAVIADTRGRALSQSFDSIAAEIKGGHR